MPDEASTPPADPPPQQVTDGQSTQTPPSEPVSAPVTEPTPPPEAVAPVSEPTQTETPAQAEVSEAVPEPQESATQPVSAQSNSPAPQQQDTPPQSTTTSQSSPLKRGGWEGPIIDSTSSRQVGELLVKARAKIQDRRRKKLERIMTKLSETGKISNNEVERLLRVSAHKTEWCHSRVGGNPSCILIWMPIFIGMTEVWITGTATIF